MKMDGEIISFISEIGNNAMLNDLLWAVIPALITMLGFIFNIVKKIAYNFDIIDIKEYTILPKVRDEKVTEHIKRWLRWACESFVIAMNQWVIWMVSRIFCTVANFRFQCDDDHRNLIVLITMFIALLYVRFRRKISKDTTWTSLIYRVIDIFFAGFLIIVVTVFLLNNKKLILLMIIIAYVEIMSCTLLVFSKYGMYKDSQKLGIKLSRGLRYLIMISLYACWIIHYQKISDLTSNLVFFVWQAWTLLDGICIYTMDDTNVVDVVLKTKNGDVRTRDKIIQQRNNKLRFKSTDGKKITLDDSQIDYILYKVHRGWINNRKHHSRCIEALGKDGVTTYYQKYRKRRDWFVFSNTDNGMCEVIYRKSKDVESVIES